jgi:hypothetical protein
LIQPGEITLNDNRTVAPCRALRQPDHHHKKTTIPVIAVFTRVVQAEQVTMATSREADKVAWMSDMELRGFDLFACHHAKITAAMSHVANGQ